MDQTVINATTEFFQTQITERDEKINSLQEHIQKVTQRSYADSAERNRIVEDMQAWTLTELENNGITESQAEEISSICGFELTQEFELEVLVNYTITVNARDEESARNTIYDIDFDSLSYQDDVVTYLSSNVDSVNI